jgi:octopine/nopaline transport system ATP-binding protein
MSVLQNVALAPMHVLKLDRKSAAERAEAMLAKVGVADKRNDYPAQLSGGQQQRVAIARALAMEPDLMLFDEPTSALDPELVGEVLKVIRDLAEEGRTMVLVTHEMGFARDVATHIQFLDKGKVEEEGPPAAIFGNPQSARLRQFLASVRD